MWPFSKKPEPPTPPRDGRVWNEDWKVGDVAECVSDSWHTSVKPWERPRIGDRLIVRGFSEGKAAGVNQIQYFLRFDEFKYGLSTTAFRKVRPIKAEESEVAQRILNAKPGVDRVRKERA